MKERRSQEVSWFDQEVLPHEKDLRVWLSSRFPTWPDLDDVIQESFFKLLKAHQSGPLVNPRAYLFVTAKNVVLGKIRHLKYERPEGAKEMDPLSIVDEMHSPLEETTRNDEIRLLIEALESLPRRCCQVMTLIKIYGFSHKEISLKLGISANTVRVQYANGLKRCAVFFRRKGYKKIRER
ncbi:MAG: sigma-70 family RNA polymerase sigma factor [Opitutales bacterium]|nr:sigma-70 family RNA polymerase sigma factor [Opitutales bacterium]